MRKLFVPVFVSLVFLLSIFSYAAEKKYVIPELDLALFLPDEDIVFLQKIPKGDSNIYKYGLDELAMEEYYVKNDIFLNSMAPDGSYEIVVTYLDYDGSNQIIDYNRFDENMMPPFITGISEGMRKKGFDVTDAFSYQSGDIRYVVMDHSQTQNNVTVFSRQYNTIYNGATFNITLHSYLGEVTGSQADLIKNVVDSAIFPPKKPMPTTDPDFIPGVTRAAISGGLSGAIGSAVAMGLAGGAYSLSLGKRKKRSPKYPGTDVDIGTIEFAARPISETYPTRSFKIIFTSVATFFIIMSIYSFNMVLLIVGALFFMAGCWEFIFPWEYRRRREVWKEEYLASKERLMDYQYYQSIKNEGGGVDLPYEVICAPIAPDDIRFPKDLRR